MDQIAEQLRSEIRSLEEHIDKTSNRMLAAQWADDMLDPFEQIETNLDEEDLRTAVAALYKARVQFRVNGNIADRIDGILARHEALLPAPVPASEPTEGYEEVILPPHTDPGDKTVDDEAGSLFLNEDEELDEGVVDSASLPAFADLDDVDDFAADNNTGDHADVVSIDFGTDDADDGTTIDFGSDDEPDDSVTIDFGTDTDADDGVSIDFGSDDEVVADGPVSFGVDADTDESVSIDFGSDDDVAIGKSIDFGSDKDTPSEGEGVNFGRDDEITDNTLLANFGRDDDPSSAAGHPPAAGSDNSHNPDGADDLFATESASPPPPAAAPPSSGPAGRPPASGTPAAKAGDKGRAPAISGTAAPAAVDIFSHRIQIDDVAAALDIKVSAQDRTLLEQKLNARLSDRVLATLQQNPAAAKQYILLPRLGTVAQATGGVLSMTVKNMAKRYIGLFGDIRDLMRYRNDSMMSIEVPETGWALVTAECPRESLGKNYMEQNQYLRYLSTSLSIPSHLVRRRTMVETIYDLIVGELVLGEHWQRASLDWTASSPAKNDYVCVYFPDEGIRVRDLSRVTHHRSLGVTPNW